MRYTDESALDDLQRLLNELNREKIIFRVSKPETFFRGYSVDAVSYDHQMCDCRGDSCGRMVISSCFDYSPFKLIKQLIEEMKYILKWNHKHHVPLTVPASILAATDKKTIKAEIKKLGVML